MIKAGLTKEVKDEELHTRLSNDINDTENIFDFEQSVQRVWYSSLGWLYGYEYSSNILKTD